MRIFRVPDKTILLVCARANATRRSYLNIFKKNSITSVHMCPHFHASQHLYLYICVSIFIDYTEEQSYLNICLSMFVAFTTKHPHLHISVYTSIYDNHASK